MKNLALTKFTEEKFTSEKRLIFQEKLPPKPATAETPKKAEEEITLSQLQAELKKLEEKFTENIRILSESEKKNFERMVKIGEKIEKWREELRKGRLSEEEKALVEKIIELYEKIIRLPKQILRRIITSGSDQAAEKLLKLQPRNKDLRNIIKWCNPEYKDKAAKILLTQNPSNEDLRNVIEWCNPEYEDKAAKILLTQNPSNENLIDIILYCSPEYKEEATKILLTQNPSYDDFRFIIEKCNLEYKDEAAKKLLTQNPINEDLRHIMERCSLEHKDEAAKKLLTQNPSNEDLIYIIEQCSPEYKKKAWEKLLTQNPSNEDLRYIIKYCSPEYKEKAAEILLTQNPSNRDLYYIYGFLPHYRERALKEADFKKGFSYIGLFQMLPLDFQKQRYLLNKLDKEQVKKIIPRILPSIRLDVWETKNLGPYLAKWKRTITVDFEKFKEVYFHPALQKIFKKHKSELTYANTFSITQGVVRYIEHHFNNQFSDKNIEKALNVVWENRERFKKHVILDEDTTLIHFTHEEERFRNKEGLDFARNCGVSKIPNEDLKGSKSKNKILDLIKKAEGKTTIWFHGHGGKTGIGLAQSPSEIEEQDLTPQLFAITYKELGNALLESKNIKNTTLIVSACYSYDYVMNLFSYLEKPDPPYSGTTEKPVVITSANKEKIGYGGALLSYSWLLHSLILSHRKGQPLMGRDFLETEGRQYHMQDSAFFVPYKGEVIQVGTRTPDKYPKVKRQKERLAERPKQEQEKTMAVPEKPPKEEKKLRKPPTGVIEVSKQEKEEGPSGKAA